MGQECRNIPDPAQNGRRDDLIMPPHGSVFVPLLVFDIGCQKFIARLFDVRLSLYKEYLVSLNVNTVEDSGTMFSRRLVEILAYGSIAVINPIPAVDHYFKDYCYVVQNENEATNLFDRLEHGPSREDLERAEAGARYVLAEHTWTHRLNKILQVIS